MFTKLGNQYLVLIQADIVLMSLVPPPPEPGCKEDRECPSREACFSGECENPCGVIKPCALNANCEVYSSLPLRTMSCTCTEGFTGKGDVRCDKISKLFSFFWYSNLA